MSSVTAISNLASIPLRARLHPVTPEHGQALRRIARVVRPDIFFVDRTDDVGTDDYLLVCGPHLFQDIRDARARGFDQRALLFPENSTAYYDFWSFPIDLIHTSNTGAMSVPVAEFERFVARFGDFFGKYDGGVYRHETSRYQPWQRMAGQDKEGRLASVIALLADEQSCSSLLAVLTLPPAELWRHWLGNLFSSLEYFDVMTLGAGDVVINAGVHGGGELTHFFARIGETGRVVNVDPLGDFYLTNFVKEAVGRFGGSCTWVPAALHDTDGTVELPVEAGGMAAGGRIGEQIPGLENRIFAARSIDSITEELELPRVDLIKMDIEGAEPNALAGAMRTIKQFRPQLAISIYHQPDHFLDIPQLLGDTLMNYCFYVRNYHFISNETILYAIPVERNPKFGAESVCVELVS